MEIHKAEFVLSNSDYRLCPPDNIHEIAFIGRSNVGKSTLINMLCHNKGLAKTSSTPGKTLLINHFMVDDSWFLVDLPGFGYAKTSKGQRSKLKRMIEDYLVNRPQLTNVFLLVDSRLAPQQIDLDFMTWMGENGIPFSIVFTKSDKNKTNQKLQNQIDTYKKVLLESWEELPPYFITSGENGQGKEELLNYIGEILATKIDKIIIPSDEVRDMTGMNTNYYATQKHENPLEDPLKATTAHQAEVAQELDPGSYAKDSAYKEYYDEEGHKNSKNKKTHLTESEEPEDDSPEHESYEDSKAKFEANTINPITEALKVKAKKITKEEPNQD